MDLIVDMGACTSTAVAHQADYLSPFDLITFLDQAFLEMGILGSEAVAVINQYKMAIPLVVALPDDPAVRRCLHISAHPAPDVYAPMVGAF